MQDARADADVALLCSPPQRTTGFSFGYNCGYGALSIWLGNRGLVGLPASPGLAGRLMCHVPCALGTPFGLSRPYPFPSPLRYHRRPLAARRRCDQGQPAPGQPLLCARHLARVPGRHLRVWRHRIALVRPAPQQEACGPPGVSPSPCLAASGAAGRQPPPRKLLRGGATAGVARWRLRRRHTTTGCEASGLSPSVRWAPTHWVPPKDASITSLNLAYVNLPAWRAHPPPRSHHKTSRRLPARP